MSVFKVLFTSFVKKTNIMFLLALLLAASNYLIATSSFSLSEGWWETYAYLEINNFFLFKDIDISFTPFFVYLNEFFIKSFGMDFYGLRVLGVFSFLFLYFLTFHFVRLFASCWISATSAFIASILFMSSDPFIAKDYHTYLHIFVVISLVFFYKVISDNSFSNNFLYAVALSISVFLTIFIKQNVGLLLLVAYLIPLLFLRKYVVVVVVFLSLVSVSFYLYNSHLWEQIIILFSQNDSKGSLGKVLFGFLTGQNFLVLMISIIMGLFYFSIYFWKNNKISFYVDYLRKKTTYGDRLPIRVDLYLFIATIFLLSTAALFLFLSSGPSFRVVFFAFMVSLLACYFLLVYLEIINVIIPVHFFWPLFVLIYANTNTAELDYIGQFENIAVFFALLFLYVERFFIESSDRFFFKYFILVTALFVFFSVLAKKYDSIYTWWIGGSYPFSEQKHTSIYPQLYGIKIDKNTFDIHKKIHFYVNKFSQEKSDVYFFNLPVFYALENKLPAYRTVTQWFDVVTTRSIVNEFESIKKSPPKLAVLFFPEGEAYVVHAIMKNQVELFEQAKILNYFVNQSRSGVYSFLNCHNYFTGKKQYGSVSVLFESYHPNFNLINSLDSFNSSFYSDVQEENLSAQKMLNNSEKKFTVNGNQTEVLKFLNYHGRVLSPGYQSVCFFVKN